MEIEQSGLIWQVGTLTVGTYSCDAPAPTTLGTIIIIIIIISIIRGV